MPCWHLHRQGSSTRMHRLPHKRCARCPPLGEHSGPADPKNLNLNRTCSGRRTFSGCSGWSIGSVRTCTHVEPLRTLLNLAEPFWTCIIRSSSSRKRRSFSFGRRRYSSRRRRSSSSRRKIYIFAWNIEKTFVWFDVGFYRFKKFLKDSHLNLSEKVLPNSAWTWTFENLQLKVRALFRYVYK